MCFQVWNLENLQCLQTMTDHTSVVMSVLCWDQFLLSCSLDKTIKVLAPSLYNFVNVVHSFRLWLLILLIHAGVGGYRQWELRSNLHSYWGRCMLIKLFLLLQIDCLYRIGCFCYNYMHRSCVWQRLIT